MRSVLTRGDQDRNAVPGAGEEKNEQDGKDGTKDSFVLVGRAGVRAQEHSVEVPTWPWHPAACREQSSPGRSQRGGPTREPPVFNPEREGTRRACQLFRCHLILVQQSTVNNNLNALVVSHCSFFVNVTRFINKSKPADPRFSET